jgi:large subunit ribosomal protein L14
MIQLNAKLSVFDNSGIKMVKCIRIFNGKNNFMFLLVTVKTLRLKQKVKPKIKKGSVIFAYLLKTTSVYTKFSGLKIKADTNGVILLNKQFQPISSRITGVVPKQIKLGGLKNMAIAGVVI